MYDFYLENYKTKESKSLVILENKVDSIQTELIFHETNLANLIDKSHSIIKSRGHLEKMRLSRKVEFLNAMYAVAVKNLEMSKLSAQHEKSIFIKIDKPVLPLKVSKKSEVLFGVFFSFLFVLLSSVFFLVRNEVKKFNV